MANIMDVINKYQNATAAGAEPADESYATGGAGVVRQNTQMQLQRATQAQALIRSAGDTDYQATMLKEQGKQASIQQDSQIAQLGQQSHEEKQQFQLKSDSIMTNLENNMGKLSQTEKMDQMGTASTFVRLQDDKYRTELADVGRRQRLDNSTSFNFALQQAVFKDQYAALDNDLSLKYALAGNDADFQKYIQSIQINSALAIANQEAADAKTAAEISGAGKVVTSIIAGATKAA